MSFYDYISCPSTTFLLVKSPYGKCLDLLYIKEKTKSDLEYTKNQLQDSETDRTRINKELAEKSDKLRILERECVSIFSYLVDSTYSFSVRQKE